MAATEINNNNAPLYATGAGLAGAAIGGTVGYKSRPFVKDGEVTDKFVNNCIQKMKNEFDEISKVAQVQKATTIDELRKIESPCQNWLSVVEDTFGVKGDDLLKELQKQGPKICFDDKYKDLMMESKTLDKFIQTILKEEQEVFDKKYSGKSLDEIKKIMIKEDQSANKQLIIETFKNIWNKKEKKFAEPKCSIEATMEKVAKNMQKKSAAIYGTIAAVVLGTVTYLLTDKKN